MRQATWPARALWMIAASMMPRNHREPVAGLEANCRLVVKRRELQSVISSDLCVREKAKILLPLLRSHLNSRRAALSHHSFGRKRTL